MDFIRKNLKWLIPSAILVIVLIVVFSFVGKVNSLRNTAIQKENVLVAQYQDNQNALSTYVVTIKESLGIANIGSERVEEILVEAVKGRYDGNMEPGTDGSMFSAIAEAYPDLTATSASYARVMDEVISGRSAYKNAQTKLLDLISNYNTWRNTDLLNSWLIESFGLAPSTHLTVRVGPNVYTGEDALHKISEIVLVQDAVDSYDTGQLEPLIDGVNPEK